MALVIALNLVGGLMFFLIGAWPIVGFMGLDVALIWWAFRSNFRDGAQGERISVTGDLVSLERVNKVGAVSKRVELEYDSERELTGRLLLWSHGKSHEIASFLGAEERQSLAQALRRVL
jgi:uncharacterized membrane protein